jgi:hypothetical protein
MSGLKNSSCPSCRINFGIMLDSAQEAMAVSHRNNIFVASSGSSWSRGRPRDCGIVNLVPPPEKLCVNADIDPRDQQPNKGEPQQTPLPPIDEPKPREAKHGGISQHRRKRIKQLYLLRCVMDCVETLHFATPQYGP